MLSVLVCDSKGKEEKISWHIYEPTKYLQDIPHLSFVNLFVDGDEYDYLMTIKEKFNLSYIDIPKAKVLDTRLSQIVWLILTTYWRISSLTDYCTNTVESIYLKDMSLESIIYNLALYRIRPDYILWARHQIKKGNINEFTKALSNLILGKEPTLDQTKTICDILLSAFRLAY